MFCGQIIWPATKHVHIPRTTVQDRLLIDFQVVTTPLELKEKPSDDTDADKFDFCSERKKPFQWNGLTISCFSSVWIQKMFAKEKNINKKRE